MSLEHFKCDSAERTYKSPHWPATSLTELHGSQQTNNNNNNNNTVITIARIMMLIIVNMVSFCAFTEIIRESSNHNIYSIILPYVHL
jgi:hypothetical protein